MIIYAALLRGQNPLKKIPIIEELVVYGQL
jgi:hypothetical protein